MPNKGEVLKETARKIITSASMFLIGVVTMLVVDLAYDNDDAVLTAFKQYVEQKEDYNAKKQDAMEASRNADDAVRRYERLRGQLQEDTDGVRSGSDKPETSKRPTKGSDKDSGSDAGEKSGDNPSHPTGKGQLKAL